jgi:hypothetical protein
MGDWLIEIQLPSGGAGEAAGVVNKKPQIFNTSQIILGWLAIHLETKDDKYFLDAAIRAADWIIENQELDGSWVKSTYAGAKAYHIRTAWALMELHYITEDKKYCTASELSFNWVLSQANSNGWFKNNNLGASGLTWTHLIGYALVGLMKLDFIRISKTLTLLDNAAKGLTKKNYSYSLPPGTFDSNWKSEDKWSCLAGNAQIAFFLHRIAEITNNSIFKSNADAIVYGLKEHQFLEEKSDLNFYGGLPGSHPIGGPYLINAIPNWGVKFFADALLQRLIPYSEHKFLG